MRSGVRAFGSGARAWLLAVGGFTLSGFSLLELLELLYTQGLACPRRVRLLELVGNVSLRLVQFGRTSCTLSPEAHPTRAWKPLCLCASAYVYV